MNVEEYNLKVEFFTNYSDYIKSIKIFVALMNLN